MSEQLYLWSWNKPCQAVDPTTFGREVYRPKQVIRLAALFSQEHERAEYLRQSEAFRPPLQVIVDNAIATDEQRDKHLRQTKDDRLAARRDRDSEPLAMLYALPLYLRNPLLQRFRALRKRQNAAETAGLTDRPASRYLHGYLKKIFRRLDRLNSRFNTPAFRSLVARERLDALLDLPQLSKREVQTAATLTSGAIEGEFNRLYGADVDSMTPDRALEIYQRLAHRVFQLNVTPPSWSALRTDTDRRTEPNLDKLQGAIARMICADWWHKKLWRLRRIWREEQLRAAGLVSRKASPYLSREALTEFREQQARMRQFLKSYELVNDDGFTIDLEDVYYASNSNPEHRYFEMMTTVKGMQMVAEERGDEAVFITVTTPSRFHSVTEDGKPNPKWDGSTVRDSSDYMVNVFFAAVRKKLNRAGLRWYGVRVVEPHHDGTVHWHMIIFSAPDNRESIVSMVCDIAVHTDRAELGDDISPRFKSELITSDKGTPTSYIAKYIGKNISARAVGGNDKTTGEPLKDNDSDLLMSESVERATAWAGLHGIRQFDFFGIPSRQVWRELRRLATQMARYEQGPQRLPDPAMDRVLAAADVGCFASYIMAQGGVLVPRSRHVIRTAYDLAEKLNDYGEQGIQIYGIWSPAIGEASRICTHPDNWQLVRKQKNAAPAAQSGVALDLSVDLPGDNVASWTRGNNCPRDSERESYPQDEVTDFTKMTAPERRKLMRRLRENTTVTVRTEPVYAGDDQQVASLIDFADSIGWPLSEWQARRMAAGGELLRGGRKYYSHGDGRIYSRPVIENEKPLYTRLDRRLRRGQCDPIRLPEPPGDARQKANELISRWKKSLGKESSHNNGCI